MRTIKALLLWFLVASMLWGCSTADINSDISYADQSWNEFIGDNSGETGAILAAPEVDDNGNNTNTHVKVSKPDTVKAIDTALPSADVPSDASAEECLEKWLKSFRKNDWTQIICLSTGLYFNPKLDNEEGAISYVLSEIEWKIKESTVENDNAKFTVEVSTPEILESLMAYIETESTIQENNDKDYEKKLKSNIKGMVKKAEKKNWTIEIEMTKGELLWKVNLTDDILNAMTGGLSDFYRELRQNYLQEVTSK